jgi:hypothetical protein
VQPSASHNFATVFRLVLYVERVARDSIVERAMPVRAASA